MIFDLPGRGLAPLPLSLLALLALTDAVVGLLLWLGIGRIADTLDLAPPVRAAVSRRTALWLTGWLLLAPLIAALNFSPTHEGQWGFGPNWFLGFILAPVVFGCVLWWRSRLWRQLVRAVPQQWLIGLQFYRNIGGVFLWAMSLGALPAFFAVPTAYGDFLAGFLAPPVALWCAHRWRGWRGAVGVWNLIGLGDFIMAIGLGSGRIGPLVDLSRRILGSGATPEAVRLFPLVLIPTFVVPIGILLHLYSLASLFNLRADNKTHNKKTDIKQTDKIKT